MHFEELLNSRVDLCYLYSLLSRFGQIAISIPISLLFPPPLTNAIDKINGYSGSTAGSMLLCGTSLAAGGLSRMQSCLFCRLAWNKVKALMKAKSMMEGSKKDSLIHRQAIANLL